MKLSTLLLSSAAVLVAGSAFAADLPAKKGAPAAKETGCPAFGAGFFQVPGSDTCISFTGYMNYVGSYTSTGSYGQVADSRLLVDARSKTDAGVARGVFRWNLDSTSSNRSSGRAYAQIGSLTAGQYGSEADISGTSPWNLTSYLGGGTGIGIKYEMAMGGATVTVAMENAANYADGTTYSSSTAKRPDFVMKVAMPAGSVTATLVGVSHEANSTLASSTVSTGQGYALLGKLGGTFGAVTAAIYGGASQGALAYTGYTGSNVGSDISGTDLSQGNLVGGDLSFDVGSGSAFVTAETGQAKLGTSTDTFSQYSVGYAYTVAKGFTVAPEFIAGVSNGTTTNTMYLRVQRDF